MSSHDEQPLIEPKGAPGSFCEYAGGEVQDLWMFNDVAWHVYRRACVNEEEVMVVRQFVEMLVDAMTDEDLNVVVVMPKARARFREFHQELIRRCTHA